MRPLKTRIAIYMVLLATTACAAHYGSATASHTPEGTVVGRIDGSSGDGYVKPPYVGGTVLALRGVIRVVWSSARTGESHE
jgi:hypothetical protein